MYNVASGKFAFNGAGFESFALLLSREEKVLSFTEELRPSLTEVLLSARPTEDSTRVSVLDDCERAAIAAVRAAPFGSLCECCGRREKARTSPSNPAHLRAGGGRSDERRGGARGVAPRRTTGRSRC